MDWTKFFTEFNVADAAIAAFTIVLGFATALLWWETKKLREDAAHSIRVLERATMSCDGAEISAGAGVDSAGKAVAFFVSVSWKNTGRTAARNCFVFCQGARLEPEQDPLDHQFDRPARQRGSTTVGPGIQVTTRMMPLTDDDVADIGARRRQLLLWSRIEYSDVFDDSIERAEEVILGIEIQPAANGEVTLTGRIIGTKNDGI